MSVLPKVFVGNLEYSVTSEELRNHFLTVDGLSIVDCVVITDKFSGRSRGFGFVELETEDQANEAIKKLNGSALKGREITVSMARPQEERPSSPPSNASANTAPAAVEEPLEAAEEADATEAQEEA